MPGIYNASLVKTSLKLTESRIIVGLLLDRVDAAGWKRAIVDENILQKRSVSTATTYADYLRWRFCTMQPELWLLVRDGPAVIATHAVLAAEIKHNRLLADFFDQAVRDQVQQFKTSLTNKEWMEFIASCTSRDTNVGRWTPGVVSKLRQVIFRIMAEAGYVNDTNSMTLQRVTVAPAVVSYLLAHGDRDVLRCMQVAS